MLHFALCMSMCVCLEIKIFVFVFVIVDKLCQLAFVHCLIMIVCSPFAYMYPFTVCQRVSVIVCHLRAIQCLSAHVHTRN